MSRVNQDGPVVSTKRPSCCKTKVQIDTVSECTCVRRRASVRCKPLWTRVIRDCGLDGLKQLPHVGEKIARAIRELVTHGRVPMLDRLRGESLARRHGKALEDDLATRAPPSSVATNGYCDAPVR